MNALLSELAREREARELALSRVERWVAASCSGRRQLDFIDNRTKLQPSTAELLQYIEAAASTLHASADERRVLLSALRSAKPVDEADVDQMRRLCSIADPMVRAAALFALLSHGPAESEAELLARALADAHPSVCTVAAEAVLGMGLEHVTALAHPLVALLTSKDLATLRRLQETWQQPVLEDWCAAQESAAAALCRLAPRALAPHAAEVARALGLPPRCDARGRDRGRAAALSVLSRLEPAAVAPHSQAVWGCLESSRDESVLRAAARVLPKAAQGLDSCRLVTWLDTISAIDRWWPEGRTPSWPGCRLYLEREAVAVAVAAAARTVGGLLDRMEAPDVKPHVPTLLRGLERGLHHVPPFRDARCCPRDRFGLHSPAACARVAVLRLLGRRAELLHEHEAVVLARWSDPAPAVRHAAVSATAKLEPARLRRHVPDAIARLADCPNAELGWLCWLVSRLPDDDLDVEPRILRLVRTLVRHSRRRRRVIGLRLLLRLVRLGLERFDSLLAAAAAADADAAAAAAAHEQLPQTHGTDADADVLGLGDAAVTDAAKTRRLNLVLDEVGQAVSGLDEHHPACQLAQELIATIEAPSGPAAARRTAEVQVALLGLS